MLSCNKWNSLELDRRPHIRHAPRLKSCRIYTILDQARMVERLQIREGGDIKTHRWHSRSASVVVQCRGGRRPFGPKRLPWLRKRDFQGVEDFEKPIRRVTLFFLENKFKLTINMSSCEGHRKSDNDDYRHENKRIGFYGLNYKLIDMTQHCWLYSEGNTSNDNAEPAIIEEKKGKKH